MLASQTAEVLRRVLDKGLDTTKFEWKNNGICTYTQDYVYRLVHKATGFYFDFDYDSHGGRSTFSPGQHTLTENHRAKDWDERYHQVSVWAEYLAREIRAADLVNSMMTQGPLAISTVPSEGNRSLNETEQAAVMEKLDQLEQHIIDVKVLTTTETALIREEFQALRLEAKRASRNAWIKMLVGTVFSIGAKFFSKEQAIAIWHFTESQFTTVVNFLTHHHG